LQNQNERYFIQKGKDSEKDQAYVLWGLSQDCMSRSIFPLGNLVKSEVRAIAKEAGFIELSKKGESYEICFVPDNDYRGFLKEQIPNLEADIGEGNFIDVEGNLLGKHKGFPFYTVGQRKGLGIAMGIPVYVTNIDPKKNEVTLGEQSDLIRNGLIADQLNFMKYDHLPEGKEIVTKIRYRDAGTVSILNSLGPDRVNVVFLANVRGVAPGQSAVFYEGDDVLGGGIIKQSL
jgi:tRNA-specific 2-thiouridylase